MSSLIQNLFPSPRGQASRRLRAFLAIRGLVIASAIVVFLGACSQPASQPTVIPSVVVAPTAAPLPPSPTVVADTVLPYLSSPGTALVERSCSPASGVSDATWSRVWVETWDQT